MIEFTVNVARLSGLPIPPAVRAPYFMPIVSARTDSLPAIRIALTWPIANAPLEILSEAISETSLPTISLAASGCMGVAATKLTLTPHPWMSRLPCRCGVSKLNTFTSHPTSMPIRALIPSPVTAEILITVALGTISLSLASQ